MLRVPSIAWHPQKMSAEERWDTSYSPESSIEKNQNTLYPCAQTHIKQYQMSSSSVQGMHFIWPSFMLVSGPQINLFS